MGGAAQHLVVLRRELGRPPPELSKAACEPIP